MGVENYDRKQGEEKKKPDSVESQKRRKCDLHIKNCLSKRSNYQKFVRLNCRCTC